MSGRGTAAFKHPDFRSLQAARGAITLAIQMQSVAVGWQVYAATEDPLDLGLVGLVQFLPMLALTLVAGRTADRTDRAQILTWCFAGFALVPALLLGTVVLQAPVVAIWAVLAFFAVPRVFSGPAASALLAEIVPAEDLSNAVAWSSTVWQINAVLGPAIGGGLYAIGGPGLVYATALGLSALATLALRPIRRRGAPVQHKAAAWADVLEGVRFVRSRPVILGAITLDLFAVLLGGATALLPIYAKDILLLGPWGLGLMRAAPAIGAATMALGLAWRPVERRSGVVLLAAVAVFGLATLGFGVATTPAVAFACLVVVGAADMISVVIRQTLVQLHTPDALRGRVSAVNQVFIGASNELGEFESGVAAAAIGPVPAVVAGGVGTLLVVAMTALGFPALRRADRLTVDVSGPGGDKLKPEAA